MQQDGKIHIAVLGSTGSIGCQTLDVVSQHPDLFQIELLTANSNSALLARVTSVTGTIVRVLAVLIVIALAMSMFMVFSVTYVSSIERRRQRPRGAAALAIRGFKSSFVRQIGRFLSIKPTWRFFQRLFGPFCPR